MSRSLTITKLRHLARLYRENIEGAADELNEVLALSWDELPALLRCSPESVARIRDHEHAAHALAAAVQEHAGSRKHRAESCDLAARLAASSLIEGVHHADSRIAIPSTPLRRLLALWPGSGLLSFGQRGAVDIAKLRSLLRACPRDPLLVVLHPRELVVRYLTPGGYGRVRFALRPARHDERLLLVPIVDEHRELTTNIHGELIDSVAPPSTWPADNQQDRSRYNAPSGPELPSTQHTGHA